MLRSVVRTLAAAGPRDTAGRLRHRYHEITRERRLGIATAANDPINGSPTPYQPYVAAPYLALEAAFDAAGCEPGDAFLDYGCGKGRVVAVAATRPFAKVVGVEMRPELVAAADRNLARLIGRRCGTVEIVTGDATAYAVPDDVTVIFLFNPFTGDVLRATLDRVRESLDRRPRDLRVVYMNPAEDPDLLAERDWLERVRDLPPGRWKNMRFGLYVHRANA